MGEHRVRALTRRRAAVEGTSRQARAVTADPSPASVDEVLELVRAGGGRATSPKRLLLEVLFADDGHLTAEEIGAAVQAKAPEVHLSTIYRNLDELQRLGVVVHCHLGHGPAVYQLSTHAHAHFVCEVCGERVTAPDDLFNGLARQAMARLGFAIDPRHFAIFGRCQTCLDRES
jgi:Fe2+ or Zn2+ uptake regulation protein